MATFYERDNVAERRGRALIALVDPHLPLEVGPVGFGDAWQLVGPSLISRQVGSLSALSVAKRIPWCSCELSMSTPLPSPG